MTGSGRGLGRAYAVALAAAGAAVVVNDVDDDVAKETADAIATAGGRAVTVVAPVGSAETAQTLVRTAVEDGGWDVDGIADLLPGTLRDHRQEFRPAPPAIPATEGTKQ